MISHEKRYEQLRIYNIIQLFQRNHQLNDQTRITQERLLSISLTMYHQLHYGKSWFSFGANTQQFHNILVVKDLHRFCLTQKFKLQEKQAYLNEPVSVLHCAQSQIAKCNINQGTGASRKEISNNIGPVFKNIIPSVKKCQNFFVSLIVALKTTTKKEQKN